MSWETFLRSHWGAIAAADIFTVKAINHVDLIRFLVFFIELRSRRIQIANIAPTPDGRWMKQMARSPTDVEDGFLKKARYLSHDRDPLLTDEIRRIVGPGGVKTVTLPAHGSGLHPQGQTPEWQSRPPTREAASVTPCQGRSISLHEQHLLDAGPGA
jgi:hypothetical protein